MTLSLSKDQLLLSQAREQLSNLVDEIDRGVKPGVSIIKDGRSQVVLISTEQYEQLTAERGVILHAVETLLDVKQGLHDFISKKTITPDVVLDKLGKKHGPLS